MVNRRQLFKSLLSEFLEKFPELVAIIVTPHIFKNSCLYFIKFINKEGEYGFFFKNILDF